MKLRTNRDIGIGDPNGASSRFTLETLETRTFLSGGVSAAPGSGMPWHFVNTQAFGGYSSVTHIHSFQRVTIGFVDVSVRFSGIGAVRMPAIMPTFQVPGMPQQRPRFGDPNRGGPDRVPVVPQPAKPPRLPETGAPPDIEAMPVISGAAIVVGSATRTPSTVSTVSSSAADGPSYWATQELVDAVGNTDVRAASGGIGRGLVITLGAPSSPRLEREGMFSNTPVSIDFDSLASDALMLVAANAMPSAAGLAEGAATVGNLAASLAIPERVFHIAHLGSPYTLVADAVAAFADESASLPAVFRSAAVAQPSRAWAITWTVLAADAAALSYLYLKRRKTRRQHHATDSII